MHNKNVFPLGKSYLYFNFQCLSVLGIWNPYEKGLKYWLYQAYWIYVILVIMAMRLANILVRSINAESSVQFLQEMSLLVVETADTIKYMAFLFNRAEVLELANAFNWERHLQGTYAITNFRNRALTEALASSKTFTIIIIITLLQYFTFSFYSYFNEADYQVDRLPIGSAPMKYCVKFVNFWMAFIYDYLSFTHLGLIAVAHDAFVMAAMINVKAQVKILNFRLERCHITEIDTHEKEADTSMVMFFECVRRLSDGPMSLDPNEELINCIKFHQQIVRTLNIFKKIYNKALLPQLFISLLLITALLLQIVLDKEDSHAHAIVALGFLIPVILQLLTFCWGGNIILVESDKSSNSLYKSRWYYGDKQFRENVKVFLGAIKQPLVVSAGGMSDLSAVTFKNILTKAYSGVAVLQNMSG